MRTLNRSKDFVSTLPTAINQKLVDVYRVKLFAKIKDSFEKKKQSIDKEQIELKEWLDKKSFRNILNPVNNYWFSRYIRA
ncbi:hypothetical protein O8C97_02145 [Aliarcobacter butzleri]|uniref:hypothetical protein n=1 Tax=Aliarcobacter butzleri TaxID=28197 RepID=UPI00263D8010|nr:hypothetical protein [Aliarcobacter butzleri]MDN5046649.1 hypothetical protein [Aliarcobacter butzleri]